MNPIQIILIGMLFVVFLYVKSKKKKTIDSIIYIFIILAGMLFIIRPEITTDLAHLIGVGRGSDLVIYFALVVGMYLYIRMHFRVTQMEEQITHIIRSEAIRNVEDAAN